MTDTSTNADGGAKPQGNPRKVLLIFGWFCVAIGAPLLLWGASYLFQAMASASWPTVEGTVTGTSIYRDRTSSGTGTTRRASVTYRYVVKYRYQVNGTDYTSDKLEMGSGNTAGRESTHGEASRAAKERFPTGKKVTVSYDPDDPGMAVLQPGANLSNWGAFMPVVLGLLFCLAGGFVLRMVSSMPERSAPTARDA